ncbi:transposase [Histidinibacterium lentulum]|uniref:transposase n=1 Tax=Histidinibacterium lentulum TaxID=2480588 RepID=UPI003CCC8A52
MLHQDQGFIDALLASIAAIPLRRSAEADAALATARRRAEAVIEIDAAGAEQRCPGCRSNKRVSWGSSRAGARRWRCKACGKTWTGGTAALLARLGGVSKPCWFALCSDASVRYAEASEARGDPPCPALIRPNSAACLPA